jgi:hypothetical protein
MKMLLLATLIAFCIGSFAKAPGQSRHDKKRELKEVRCPKHRR